MKRQQELILKNSMKISEISDAVKFATDQDLKAFKNCAGLHPLELQAQAQFK